MMLTSDKCNLTAGRCAELGIVAHLIKPLGRAELLAAARRVLHIGAEIPEPAVTSKIMHERPARSLRILLAEDNAVNRKLATTILERAGHSVATAEDGRQAVERVRSSTFDLVLMDVQMPEMDGLEAARLIRREEMRTGAHVAMIAMTAHAMTGDIERCLAAGMDGYIAKPFQPRDFLETIETVKAKLDGEELPSIGD
jgi:two-component system, sensor histidine kinase and response regulator